MSMSVPGWMVTSLVVPPRLVSKSSSSSIKVVVEGAGAGGV